MTRPAQDPYDDEGYDASAEYEDDYDDEDDDYDDEDEDEETRQARVKDYMTRLGLTNDDNDPEQKIELVTDETVLLHLPDTPEEDAHTTVTEPETYAGRCQLSRLKIRGRRCKKQPIPGRLLRRTIVRTTPKTSSTMCLQGRNQ